MKTIIRSALCTALFFFAGCVPGDSDTSWYSTDCSSDIQSGRGLNILAIPDSLQKYRELYCKYTKITAPNGKAIRIFAQNEISNEQLLYARALLEFYLDDYPGSEYGSDKSAIADSMANNGAILSMLNGRDGEFDVPYESGLVGQPLYDNETPVIGSPAYINNDYERRDAAFEEILHFVHDAGIGIDFPGAPKGAAPDFQKRVRAAATDALPENRGIWASDIRMKPWLDEIREDGSITQEYLASVVDSYYGLWGPYTEGPGGMWGGYVAKTREEIAVRDPMGYAVIEMFFNPYLTLPARVDAGFEGTFRMHFDSAYPYTHKSQYLVNVSLLGDSFAGIDANDRDNRLAGNGGDNSIDGREGTDTVVFSGEASDYTIERKDGDVFVTDNRSVDGQDQLRRIEFCSSRTGLWRSILSNEGYLVAPTWQEANQEMRDMMDSCSIWKPAPGEKSSKTSS